MTMFVSVSKLTTLLTCPRRFAFRYIERRTPERFGSSAVLGTAVHASIERLHLHARDGTRAREGEVEQLLTADLAAGLDDPVVFKNGETPESLEAEGLAMIRTYADYFDGCGSAVLAAESEFSVPIGDVDGEEIVLRGFLDATFAGEIVVELKTSARKISDWAYRIQIAGYWTAFRIGNGRPPAAIRAITIVRGKQPRIEQIDLTRTDEDIDWFVALATESVGVMRGGFYPPAPSVMSCATCSYTEACARWRGPRMGQSHSERSERRHLELVG